MLKKVYGSAVFGIEATTITVENEFKTEKLNTGLTEFQLAKMLNVNRNFIYELELAKRK